MKTILFMMAVITFTACNRPVDPPIPPTTPPTNVPAPTVESPAKK